MKICRILALIALLQPLHLLAQDGEDTRSVQRANLWSLGTTQILDTYLSPEKYKGLALRSISQTTQDKTLHHWARQTTWHTSITYTHNRADNANNLGIDEYYSYAWHRKLPLKSDRLRLKAGVMVEGRAGILYNTRNSNNPVQARLSAAAKPSVVADYRFEVKKHPLLLRYEADFPLLGLMFSPNYGQSYYEIFSRGNYDHNVIVTTPINTPSFRQMLTADLTLGKTVFRFGYLGDYQQAKINSLKQHEYTHALLLGIVKTLK